MPCEVLSEFLHHVLAFTVSCLRHCDIRTSSRWRHYGSGGFRHVQHVRPNRGPHKKGPHKSRGAEIFFHAGNNGRHPSERVKWIKATVMSKKRSPVFQEKWQLLHGRWWLKKDCQFFQEKWGPPPQVTAPIFFPNRALLRVNPALLHGESYVLSEPMCYCHCITFE